MVAFEIYAIIKTVSIVYHEHLQEAVTERCSLKSFESENIETLYLLSELKEPVQIEYKRACCYGTSMNINVLLTYLLKISLTL